MSPTHDATTATADGPTEDQAPGKTTRPAADDRAGTTPLLETRALTKHFRMSRTETVHAVDDLSLTIAENEILGLVGESGSGKSTFGKTVLGLHDKTAGEVIYRGETLPQMYSTEDFRHNARRMQMIFQDPYSSLNPRMTAGEIIAEGLRMHSDLAPAVVRDRVVQWLEQVGLNADHRSRYPHEFSGGQRQRIGIARAMIVEPEFVVCDEPISALDVSVQAQVINLLSDLKTRLGLTLLFIAHDLSMVRYVSDRMAVMYLGALCETGPSNDVFFRPMHPYTQLLIQSNPEPDPEFERTRTHETMKGEIPSPVNVGAGCRFAARCPKVMEVCRGVTPEPVEVRDETSGLARQVACHLYP